jgi:hypothetical protein
MIKYKGLTHEEHLENADDFAMAFHYIHKIFERCLKVYPKKHRIMQILMTLDNLQDIFTSEYYKVVTNEQTDKERLMYYDLKNRYNKLMNK